MKANPAVYPQQNSFLAPVLRACSALLVAAVLLGFNGRIGFSDRTAFFALLTLGMALCGMGKLGQGQVYGWWNPRHLVGYLLGALGLLFAAAVAFGWPLPFALTERGAVGILATLMLVKLGIGALYPRRPQPGN